MSSDPEYVYVRYRETASSVGTSSISPSSPATSFLDATAPEIFCRGLVSIANIANCVTPSIVSRNKGSFFFLALGTAGAGVLYWALTDPSDPLGLEEGEDKDKLLPTIEPTGTWQEVLQVQGGSSID